MSYIQITTRCNMLCKHCCYACTPDGEDMSMKVFKKAVAISEEYGANVSIGGGEPTLHPNFWEMLGHLLGNPHMECIWLATNGKRTRDALALCRLAKMGVVGVALSIDPWHEPIDEKVVIEFRRGQDTYSRSVAYPDAFPDLREIRTVTELVWAGRAKAWLPEPEEAEDCPCQEMHFDPAGNIRQCGCEGAPIIGNVYDGLFDDYEAYLDEDSSWACAAAEGALA